MRKNWNGFEENFINENFIYGVGGVGGFIGTHLQKLVLIFHTLREEQDLNFKKKWT